MQKKTHLSQCLFFFRPSLLQWMALLSMHLRSKIPRFALPCHLLRVRPIHVRAPATPYGLTTSCWRASARPQPNHHLALRRYTTPPPPKSEPTPSEDDGNQGPSSFAWWWDKFVVCVVFAIAGSSVLFLVRPFIKNVLKLEGSLIEGPNSFRVLYVLLVTPVYSCVLMTTAILFGRRAFFQKVVLRMWGRVLPRSIVDKLR